MKDRYILLTEKEIHLNLFNKLKRKFKEKTWFLINSKKDFNFKNIKKLRKKKIFIPHWSYKIPKEIFSQFNCILFHMTDLPFGRGGSPLQNLIVLGYNKTKISAFKVEEEIDAGPIFLKKNLGLTGTSNEIFKRTARIIFSMIIEILEKDIKAIPQDGIPTYFMRRKPSESNIKNLKTINQVYDYIRMLDSDGYPHAFIENDNFIFKFREPFLKGKKIFTKVEITEKNEKNEKRKI